MSEVLWDGAFLHASGGLTGNAYELIEMGGNKGFGPPLHVHEHRSEAFYVLRGSFELQAAGTTAGLHSGEFFFVPPGTPHRFEATADDSALLFVVAPAGLEGFFKELHQLLVEGLDETEVRARLARQFDSQPAPLH